MCIRDRVKEPIISEPYLLVYDLNKGCMAEEKQAFVRMYAKKKCLKIVAVNDSMETRYAQVNINNAGPEEFVNLIANANFVLSDSFHATAFSCIMQTPFRVYFNFEQAVRIRDFLEMVGVGQCMNSKVDEDYAIDWKRVKAILDGRIKESKEYLKPHTDYRVL